MRDKANNLIKKYRNKENLPIILFLIVLLNYFPLNLVNMFTKEAHAVSILPMAVCFAIEIAMLILYFFRKIEFTKEIKKNIVVLFILTVILLIIQVKNVILGNLKLNEFFNIGCQFINFILLFIFMIDIKISDKKIFLFMKCLVYMGMIACIHNVILYFGEMFQTLGFMKGAYMVHIKSFFANRNQFAFFLYVAIIADLFLVEKENNKRYKFFLLIFLINLFFTMSRTGLATVTLLGVFYLIFTKKISNKIKIKSFLGILILGIIGILIINIINPLLIKKVIRLDEFASLSGRTDIWNKGFEILKQNPLNIIFGVGRFNAIENLEIHGKFFTQFHNTYLDILIVGGLFQLFYVIWIYNYVVKKVFTSNIDKKYKILYKCAFITYFIYILFESCGRFSIGCVDTLCFIFFITIPLLHANSSASNENLEDFKFEKYLKNLNMKELKKTIFNKNSLPIILIILIFLNYLPLIVLNYKTKNSIAAGVNSLIPAFGIGFIFLTFFYLKKIKISKSMIIEFILLLVMTVIWSLVQIINIVHGTYYMYDIFNIVCKFVNVLYLFILLINMEINERYVYNFMKGLVIFGIISCIFNFIFYHKEILTILKIIEGKAWRMPRSFFAHKNQFAYFLFTCIVSSLILFVRSEKKKFKLLHLSCIGLFFINMIFSSSRTGLVITVVFLTVYLLFNNMMKISQKLIAILILIVMGGLSGAIIYKINPELVNKLVRKESISTLTGRTEIWDIALNLVNERPENLIFGTGRFRGIEVINNAKMPYTQFHNTYIEFLISGGIIELVYFASIYIFVIVNVLKSRFLDKKYKIIYSCMYLVYFIYMFSESLGRFSIGGSDCLGLIFFVTIPLLHSNSKPSQEYLDSAKENVEGAENK